MSKMLAGKVAIVTGANQGLGLEISKKYLEAGADLMICARNAELLEKARQELMAQAGIWLMAGFIILHLSDTIHLHVRTCCEAINTGRLQFIPKYGQPPEFSEELHEKFSVLSQIIYFENFAFLTCGWAKPTMTTRIEMEFRNQLRDVYPVLFKICPLTMRTETILLVRDTVLILSLRPTDEVRFGIWKQSCGQLVTLLDECSQNLLSNLRKFQELGDTSGAGMIRVSCVNCLAHLAVLYEALGKIEPAARVELDALCDSVLERLSALARDIRMEEYTRLDLLLRASWKKTLAVFEARLVHAPFEHGAKLREWKESVAKVYADFAAKLPDAEPPTPATWEKSGDDRTKGSWYQDLAFPVVEQQYY